MADTKALASRILNEVEALIEQAKSAEPLAKASILRDASIVLAISSSMFKGEDSGALAEQFRDAGRPRREPPRPRG
jgi:hypothetical protein